MQVNLSFDTEKEEVENLKKLVDALQQLICSKTGQQYQPQQQGAPQPAAPPKPVPSQTSGGCRVIPYEDMSSKMANVFSGRRI